MFLIVILSVITVFIVIVPILIFMCTETEEQEPVTEYKYTKVKRNKLDIQKPTDEIKGFDDNADEISVNADYHVIPSNGKKPLNENESPENEIGFNINQNIQKQSESSGPEDYSYNY